MLLVLLVIVILRSKRHLGTGLQLGCILRDVVSAIYIDGTGLVSKVKVTILGVDGTANLSGKLVVCILVCCCNKVCNCFGRSIVIIRSFTFLY